MQGPERPRVAEDDQVEQAVVAAGPSGANGKPEGVSGQVEDERRRAGSDLPRDRVARSVTVRCGEAVAEARRGGPARRRPPGGSAGHPPRGATRARWCRVTTSASNPKPAIRANRAAASEAQVDPRGPAGEDRRGQRLGVRRKPKCRANRFSVPAGRTVTGTPGARLIRAATVPSPPAATRQRHDRSRGPPPPVAACSSRVQADPRLQVRAAGAHRPAERRDPGPGPGPNRRWPRFRPRTAGSHAAAAAPTPAPPWRRPRS